MVPVRLRLAAGSSAGPCRRHRRPGRGAPGARGDFRPLRRSRSRRHAGHGPRQRPSAADRRRRRLLPEPLRAPMLLAINANNTNVKFAVYDGDKPVGAQWMGDWRIKTEVGRTADQYIVWLSQLMVMAGLNLKQIDAAIIASVVPHSLFDLTKLCEHHLKTKPLVVGDAAVKLGIQVKMDIPVATVGADRLANAVGGHIAYKKPL